MRGMTDLWTSAEIAAATGGKASAPFVVSGVAFDSREVGSGDLFIALRSEEHTSELQSLMRISYAVFCLKKKKKQRIKHIIIINDTNMYADIYKCYTQIKRCNFNIIIILYLDNVSKTI